VWSARLPWLAAVALALTLAWVGWLYHRAAAALPTEPAQLTIHAPEGVQFPPSPNFSLSPDGRYLAFAPQLGRNRMLWVQSLVTGEVKPLPLTEGAAGPFWKPDSQAIGYFTSEYLKVVALSGGPPVVVAGAPRSFVGAWNRAGMILVSRGSQGIHKVLATGGTLEPATVVASGETGHRAPVFLPDGVHFLYVAQLTSTRGLELRVGSLDSKESVESVGPVESSAGYAGGYVFFVRAGHMSGGNLMAWAFDINRRRPIGEPVALGLPASIDPATLYGGFPSQHRRIGWCTCPVEPCST